IWDPSLILSLTGSGLEYTFLDEEDFLSLGIPPERAGIPCVTENQGRILTCFPVNGALAKDVLAGNFAPLDQTIRSRFGDEQSLLAIFLSLTDLDDQPFFRRRENGLESLLEALRSNYPGMVCVHPGGYLKRVSNSFERVFFAASNYAALSRRVGISAPPSAERQSWRQFLTDFEASNRLYSKMVHVHLLVSSLRGDKFKKKSALEELWMGQSLRAYLPDGRTARVCRPRAFKALIGAEVLARDKVSFQSALTALDFDLDGVKEFLFQGKRFNLFIDPVGGMGFEWDWLDHPWNWLDADGWNEPYPPKLFVDRFFVKDHPESSAVAVFAGNEFRLVDLDRDQKVLTLSAVAPLPGSTGPVRLRKTFTFDEQGVTLDLDLELLSGSSWSGWYSNDSHLYCEADRLCEFFVPEGFRAGLRDGSCGTSFAWDWLPETPALTEVCRLQEGADSGEYTSHHFALSWPITLQVGESWQARIRWTVS
ncbi:MAG: hypothetical protein HKM06_04545, partial [Spirochaetales bacterium]|nr:hypothetical protein [Spirochaetales bacterium]